MPLTGMDRSPKVAAIMLKELRSILGERYLYILIKESKKLLTLLNLSTNEFTKEHAQPVMILDLSVTNPILYLY